MVLDVPNLQALAKAGAFFRLEKGHGLFQGSAVELWLDEFLWPSSTLFIFIYPHIRPGFFIAK
jgi:hypothetical protein